MQSIKYILLSLLSVFFISSTNSLFSQELGLVKLKNFDLETNYFKPGEKVTLKYEVDNIDSLKTAQIKIKFYLTQSPASYMKLDIVQEITLSIPPIESVNNIQNIALPADIPIGKWFISFQVVTLNNEKEIVETGNYAYIQINIHEVTVYGVSQCGYTRGMMSDLEYFDIPYQFKDVNKSAKYDNEMWAHLKKIEYTKSTTNFPVVDAKNNILIRPKIAKVRKYVD